MKIKSLQSWLFLILLFSACQKNEDKKPVAPPEGFINLSDLITKHDYYLPFAILNDTDIIQTAKLNNEVIKFGKDDFIEFKENGFNELVLDHKNFLFTTTTKERENSEWGIRAWVPVPYKTESLGSETVEIFFPRRYTESIKVPFIFYVKESGIIKAAYYQGIYSSSGENFNIKLGVGSVSISSTSLNGAEDFLIGGKHFGATVAKIQESPTILPSAINSALDVPANSFVRIIDNLNISPSGSLTIHEGSVIIIDEAVDINVNGPLIISGTAGNPVFFTCSSKDKYWGGFITRIAGGTVDAKYTIFSQSGYHNTAGYNWGHAGRQALFYTENSTLKLDHCFILDNIGQIFFPQNSVLNFNNILVQRAPTGGQINTSDLTIMNSVFTDFPDESDLFADNDNDALYLSASDANIESTVFMFAKDDGLDSGADEGGEIVVTNCRFEACFHEGAALSSIDPVVKHHTFRNCIFTNCGQGLELGYSSPNHSVLADNCQFLKNGVGIRYGDNYDWSSVRGRMHIRNSLSWGNDKDVWNMIRQTWSPKIENLSFENTKVSKFCPQYPALEIKN